MSHSGWADSVIPTESVANTDSPWAEIESENKSENKSEDAPGREVVSSATGPSGRSNTPVIRINSSSSTSSSQPDNALTVEGDDDIEVTDAIEGQNEHPFSLSPDLNRSPGQIGVVSSCESSPDAVHTSGDDAHILQKENDDLRTATSESDNIIMELNMDTTVRYLSECWDDIVG
ncbi:hypothetical protein AWJ20_3764 [Sugiyamaella lignohabitans]|uniref:Uncharacterized protein n=1 Tax=Sugiyamaella lignohabitans TaxID=796027 RepID=A0A167BY29_9ASCO|nr:uncharacterized protein AWJ20_3764 [Sugiyamaella lignohabitans]ANB10970.1 hypothetical protein AWJ20_3764 [Sugiyamaella lignohabitans]